jgi:HlyD family secretion protein
MALAQAPADLKTQRCARQCAAAGTAPGGHASGDRSALGLGRCDPAGCGDVAATGGKAALLTGKVERVEPVPCSRAPALGIEGQRVNVNTIVKLDPGTATPSQGDGFRVAARITIQTQDDALLAPSSALVRDGSGRRVFVVEGGRARTRAVTVKDRNADQAWTQDGLRTGETVLLYPGSMIVGEQAVKTRQRSG